ncbi:hypothetical protein [Haladaptatus pallidirubidus]|uniref:hypothetical protein n=1 Tax=Haladaptatus pallidirubidus TaxID=1008152 RepID=UPI001D0F8EC6|nr:hypothetical protein [Haladaptatus pallidirubidus]
MGRANWGSLQFYSELRNSAHTSIEIAGSSGASCSKMSHFAPLARGFGAAGYVAVSLANLAETLVSFRIRVFHVDQGHPISVRLDEFDRISAGVVHPADVQFDTNVGLFDERFESCKTIGEFDELVFVIVVVKIPIGSSSAVERATRRVAVSLIASADSKSSVGRWGTTASSTATKR